MFRTAAGTVAVDFCQGPINNGGEPEQRDEYRSGFYLRPEQRDRLARQVAVFLITHRHHDHADPSLARRLVEQRKTVIGPRIEQNTIIGAAKHAVWFGRGTHDNVIAGNRYSANLEQAAMVDQGESNRREDNAEIAATPPAAALAPAPAPARAP